MYCPVGRKVPVDIILGLDGIGKCQNRHVYEEKWRRVDDTKGVHKTRKFI